MAIFAWKEVIKSKNHLARGFKWSKRTFETLIVACVDVWRLSIYIPTTLGPSLEAVMYLYLQKLYTQYGLIKIPASTATFKYTKNEALWTYSCLGAHLHTFITKAVILTASMENHGVYQATERRCSKINSTTIWVEYGYQDSYELLRASESKDTWRI